MVRLPKFPAVLSVVVLAHVAALPSSSLAQGPTATAAPGAGEVEAQKCEERIASVQRDVMNKYDTGLQELQIGFQKAADLESALAVRDERVRLNQSGALTQGNLVNEPKALRALQMQMMARQQELSSQLVDETVPRLTEYKKQLTVAGRLDEAVAVRNAIERLQRYSVPPAPPQPGAVIQAETILKAYSTDKSRGDFVYRNQKLTVHGLVAGFKQDPDGRHYLIYVAGAPPATGLIQCSFNTSDYRFREDTQFGQPVLVVTLKDGSTSRLQRGAQIDLAGTGGGYDENVRMNKCEFVK